LGPIHFTVAVGGNALVLARMARTVRRDRPETCAWWFLRGVYWWEVALWQDSSVSICGSSQVETIRKREGVDDLLLVAHEKAV